MSRIMSSRDIRTLAYVLRRTNYGEADRILNIITPTGKMSVVAKGVRKEKSKLAGGIEMFSQVDLNIHWGKGEMGLVTSARMVKYFGNLLKDYNRMELAALILKKISIASEGSDNAEYFEIVTQSLSGLNDGFDMRLVESWFLLNLTKASGVEVNLYRDSEGKKLMPEKKYYYDAMMEAFVETSNGDVGSDEIKLLRLMWTTRLDVVNRIRDVAKILSKVLNLARIMSGAV